MTAEPSLFDKIWALLDEYGSIIDANELDIICSEYDKRMADLEASNRNMASRLKKLMEKK